MSVKQAFVDAGGIRTRYFDAGSGPVVILLHGSSLAIDAWSTWHRTIPDLARHFRVLAPDLVGFGETDVAADGTHVPRFERRLHALAFIRAMGVGKCAVVGHSEGAFIGAVLAIENPHLVSDLVIVTSGATAPALGGALDKDWSVAAAAAYNVGTGCETEDDFIRTNSRLSVTNPTPFLDMLRANYRLARARGQLERFKAAAQNGDYRSYTKIQEEKILPHLKHAPARKLLLWASEDATVPVSRGIKLLKHLPGADMRVFADAAHMVMIDRPTAFNFMLSNWLRKV